MVDYSNWENIEISDDEDDIHPNIDSPSLFKLRHRTRVERMAKHQKTKEDIQNKLIAVEKQLKEWYEKAKECQDIDVKNKLKELESEKKTLEEKAQELQTEEKKMAWNVDTISKERWSKSVINKPVPKVDKSQLSGEELHNLYKDFVSKNEKKIKYFSLLGRHEDQKEYLLSNRELVCEETVNYMALSCLEMEMNGKHDLMEFVSKQVITLQFIIELSKELDVDPRDCVNNFFKGSKKDNKRYKIAFEEELTAFRERIRERAHIHRQELMKETEGVDRQKMLGPGGLDPIEVFESLPECLQKCFESRDISLLKKTIPEMDSTEAEYHMKRCIDSGLWISSSEDILNIDRENTFPNSDDMSSHPKVSDK